MGWLQHDKDDEKTSFVCSPCNDRTTELTTQRCFGASPTGDAEDRSNISVGNLLNVSRRGRLHMLHYIISFVCYTIYISTPSVPSDAEVCVWQFTTTSTTTFFQQLHFAEHKLDFDGQGPPIVAELYAQLGIGVTSHEASFTRNNTQGMRSHYYILYYFIYIYMYIGLNLICKDTYIYVIIFIIYMVLRPSETTKLIFLLWLFHRYTVSFFHLKVMNCNQTKCSATQWLLTFIEADQTCVQVLNTGSQVSISFKMFQSG